MYVWIFLYPNEICCTSFGLSILSIYTVSPLLTFKLYFLLFCLLLSLKITFCTINLHVCKYLFMNNIIFSSIILFQPSHQCGPCFISTTYIFNPQYLFFSLISINLLKELKCVCACA